MEGHRHAMESIQTTEFGSKRFHDKIEQQQHQHQQQQQQQQQHHHHHETQHDTDSFASGSKFILPLRESRAEVDPIRPEKREKRVFPNLRHKFSFLHQSKPTQLPVDVPPVPQVAQISTSASGFRESIESRRQRLHLKYVQEHGHGLKMGAHTFNPIEKEIMDMYDDETLLRVHEVFPLVISSFCRRLRPPTYVGRVERSLRGYVREKPSDDVHSAILCIGGLREVERLWEIKGYNKRRTAVDTWFCSLTKDALSSEHPASPEQPVKTRRGLFGRKKSTSGESREGTREHHRSSFSSLHRTRSATGSIDNGWTFDSNWIFNTSLSAGVPMGSLSREQAQTILDDLPVLQSIWLPTAEAIILQRKVVNRTQDIRRNQQVMLDLIREEGLDSMDEWCYGSKLHDSVKPPPTTAGDDEAD
ncbi:uncharacterized protein J7T54_008267 [Emericellopsis cladophorae]|uniref:Uncharacterized protein n=1 Tax=Emericellopsis cladophorae TaxID=2686198 RepID=A0A9P9XWB7_9HYPO|nr:uncharacterized protein J7T54_008267 [Emericellopsis cladophorae]KAI6779049.1 hypothetical protein J7T54_008267 [Emericellopsis cladophorae]